MKIERVEVIYHPEFPADPLGDPLNRHPPTIGLKVTAGGQQYGAFRALDPEHSGSDMLWDLSMVAMELYQDLEGHLLTDDSHLLLATLRSKGENTDTH